MRRKMATARIEPKGSTLGEEFDALSRWIDRDTGFSSRTTDSIEHPGFEQVVSYGRRMLPVLLEALKNRRGVSASWWTFEAVRRIVGKSPRIPKDASGRYLAIVSIYAGWVEEHLNAVVEDGATLPVNSSIIDRFDLGTRAFEPFERINFEVEQRFERLALDAMASLSIAGFTIETSTWLG